MSKYVYVCFFAFCLGIITKPYTDFVSGVLQGISCPTTERNEG